MKKWEKADMEEMNIEETACHWPWEDPKKEDQPDDPRRRVVNRKS